MEMAQIRSVLAAAKHLNFTRAAADYCVTQPALTKGIKALEAELGAPLFHRECPSSDDLGHEELSGNGGSGSWMVQSMPRSGGAASGASRWSAL